MTFHDLPPPLTRGRYHPDLWKKEVHKVVECAFVAIQDDGSDINSAQMDIIEVSRPITLNYP